MKLQQPTQAVTLGFIGIKWCPGADSNHRHADFQSAALPTELPGQSKGKSNPLKLDRIPVL